MKKLVALFAAVFLHCAVYSQSNFNPFGGAGRTGAVSFTINNDVYVGLGESENTYYHDFWKYSLETDQWTRIADYPGGDRAYSQSFSINGKGYVGLGRCAKSNTTFQDFYSYDPASNKWTKLNNFAGGPRADAVGFVIGNDAYIGTGNNEAGVSQKDFWKYNVVTDTWTQLTSAFSGDVRHSASAFTLNGKAYVVGGSYFSSYSVQLSDVQEYNPATNKWTEKIFADGINLSFNDATAFGYNGKGYICYGNKKIVVSYDPTTNKVENLGNLLNLEGMRMNSISFILNSTAYLGLGFYSHDDGSAFGVSMYDNGIYKFALPKPNAPSNISISNDTIVEYQPNNTLVGNLITEDEDNSSKHTYALVDTKNYPDNAFFTISESSLYASTMNYSLQNTYVIRVKSTNNNNGLSVEKTLTILVKKEHIALGINPFKGSARESAVQFTIGDTVYIGLGCTANNEFLDDFWKYSPTTNKWERIKPFPGGKKIGAVAFSIDNIGYVGLGSGGSRTKEFYSYNPATNTWTQIADFGGSARYRATSFVIDGVAYVGSGDTGLDQCKDFWKYDPKTNKWTAISPFSGGKRCEATSFSLNGKGYVVGGYYVENYKVTSFGDVHEYNPATDSWIEKISYGYFFQYDLYRTTLFVHKNKAYSWGGDKKMIVYDPLKNDFYEIGNMLGLNDRRACPLSFIINDSVYFGLGQDWDERAIYKNDILNVMLPENPSNIVLTDSTILENQPHYSVVGALSAVDETANAKHSFQLIDNANYPDNAAFIIDDNYLQAKTLNYANQNRYKIRIKATNNYGLSIDKVFVVLVEKAATGIESQNSTDKKFVVFPNPVKSIVNVKCNTNEVIERLEVYNVDGMKMKSAIYKSELDLSDLPSSCYILHIITNDGIYYYPLVVE